MTQRTAIIGDVHGMLPELKALISSLNLRAGDRVVFVGDLVDKGPDSAGVVSYARSLREKGLGVVLVKGNHEEKHERFRRAFKKAGWKGIKKFKDGDALMSITEKLSPEDVAFLEFAVPFFEMPEFGAVVVHGGITGDMVSLNADKGTVNKLLRTRYVRGKTEWKITIEFTGEGDDALSIEEIVRKAIEAKPVREQRKEKGSFLALGQNGPDDPFWADVYDGRFGHVYFGHSPFIGAKPAHFPHATGLDTGAVFGGSLTAAVLEEGKDPRFVSVPSSGKYAEPLEEE